MRRGFRAFKWSPFRGLPGAASESAAIAAGAELMAAARDAVGPDVDIFVECAEKLSPRTALAAAEAFAPYRPGWFEEPIPFENAAAMAALQQQLPVPIATGERLLSRFEFRELLERGGCRIVQPDVMHAAGITETVRIAAMADTYYVPLAPHNSGGPIATLASLHVAAATPNLLVLEQMEDERPLRDRLCTDPVVYADGQFQLPTGPGLGSDLRLEALAERGFRPQPIQDVSATIWR